MEIRRLEQGIKDMNNFLSVPTNSITAERLHLADRIKEAEAERDFKASDEFLHSLIGTIGCTPLD